MLNISPSGYLHPITRSIKPSTFKSQHKNWLNAYGLARIHARDLTRGKCTCGNGAVAVRICTSLWILGGFETFRSQKSFTNCTVDNVYKRQLLQLKNVCTSISEYMVRVSLQDKYAFQEGKDSQIDEQWANQLEASAFSALNARSAHWEAGVECLSAIGHLRLGFAPRRASYALASTPPLVE